MTHDIEKKINLGMTDEEIQEIVIDYVCEKCGDEFDKPGSCEECVEYNLMEAHKNYLYNLAVERRNSLRSNPQT